MITPASATKPIPAIILLFVAFISISFLKGCKKNTIDDFLKLTDPNSSTD
jgi:hypothetical protein